MRIKSRKYDKYKKEKILIHYQMEPALDMVQVWDLVQLSIQDILSMEWSRVVTSQEAKT